MEYIRACLCVLSGFLSQVLLVTDMNIFHLNKKTTWQARQTADTITFNC